MKSKSTLIILLLFLISSMSVIGASYDSSLVNTYNLKNKTNNYVVEIKDISPNTVIITVRDQTTADIQKFKLSNLKASDKKQLNNLNKLIVTEKNNQSFVQGQIPAKFLGFIPTHVTQKYVISSEGLTAQRNLFHGFFKIQNSAQEAG